MEGFVAQKLNDFETGKISRRRLIETLTLAATSLYAADGAGAQADKTLKAQLINHISYSCPDFRQGADWYSKISISTRSAPPSGMSRFPFGKKGEQPYGVTATDVPLTHLIIRTPDQSAPAPSPTARARPAPQAVIDHISYTVADFDRARAKAELIALGVKNVRETGPRGLHMDDVFGYDIEISGIDNTALNDG